MLEVKSRRAAVRDPASSCVSSLEIRRHYHLGIWYSVTVVAGAAMRSAKQQNPLARKHADALDWAKRKRFDQSAQTAAPMHRMTPNSYIHLRIRVAKPNVRLLSRF
jgi:hypothetical protein